MARAQKRYSIFDGLFADVKSIRLQSAGRKRDIDFLMAYSPASDPSGSERQEGFRKEIHKSHNYCSR